MTTTEIKVSNSELQTFKECRRKWWLSYYRALQKQRKEQRGPLALGTRVHGALEVQYKPCAECGGKGFIETEVPDGTGDIQCGLCLGATDPVAAYNALAALDREAFIEVEEAFNGFPPTADQLKKFDSELALGRIMVEGYVEWLAETGADEEFEVVAAESKIEVPFGEFNGFAVWLIGKLDLRVRRKSDGARLFLDHKTCQSIQQMLNNMRLNEQFIHYQYLEAIDAASRNEPWVMTQGSMVNLLRKVKRTASANPPFYHREEVHHSTVEINNYAKRLQGEIENLTSLRKMLDDGIDPLYQAYPTPTRDCSWKCQFWTVCPMFDDGSDAERFLTDHFELYDPHDRYADDKEGDIE